MQHQLSLPQKREIFFNASKEDSQQMVYMGKMALLWGDIISLYYANVCRRKSKHKKCTRLLFYFIKFAFITLLFPGSHLSPTLPLLPLLRTELSEPFSGGVMAGMATAGCQHILW